MTDTFYEMPEQDVPMYKQPFLIKCTTSISFQSRLDTWNYFFSIRSLPFKKWGLARAPCKRKGSPLHKGLFMGDIKSWCWSHLRLEHFLVERGWTFEGRNIVAEKTNAAIQTNALRKPSKQLLVGCLLFVVDFFLPLFQNIFFYPDFTGHSPPQDRTAPWNRFHPPTRPAKRGTERCKPFVPTMWKSSLAFWWWVLHDSHLSKGTLINIMLPTLSGGKRAFNFNFMGWEVFLRWGENWRNISRQTSAIWKDQWGIIVTHRWHSKYTIEIFCHSLNAPCFSGCHTRLCHILPKSTIKIGMIGLRRGF